MRRPSHSVGWALWIWVREPLRPNTSTSIPATDLPVLSLRASSAAMLGTSTLTITGTAGKLTSSTTFSLNIHAPTFTLPSPWGTTVCQGTSVTNYYSVNPEYGFTGSVKLAVAGLPSG